MKVATISGCSTCPYNVSMQIPNSEARQCSFGTWKIGFQEYLTDLPHPECKLPDLPSEEDIRAKAEDVCSGFESREFDTITKLSIDIGANFVIKAINGK